MYIYNIQELVQSSKRKQAQVVDYEQTDFGFLAIFYANYSLGGWDFIHKHIFAG